MQRIYSGSVRADKHNGKTIFKLRLLYQLNVFLLFARALLILSGSLLLFGIHRIFLFIGVAFALMMLARSFRVLWRHKSPCIYLDIATISFDSVIIELKDIQKLMFRKVTLNGFQRIINQLKKETTTYYHLTIVCSHTNIIMPFIMEENFAETVAWLIARTAEKHQSRMIYIVSEQDVSQRAAG